MMRSTPASRPIIAAAIAAMLATALPSAAQDTKAWLEAQNVEATSTKSFNEFEAMVAHTKGTPADERAVVLKAGKPIWQSNPKETDPGSRWTLHSIGRDLAGNSQPDVHFSSYTGGANCFTTHHVYHLKPHVKHLATYPPLSLAVLHS